jgi:dipeptidyl aminopeptidase/acylaminoacyl peptidase
LPPGRTAKNLPLIVMPHGGPIGVFDRPGFDAWAQAFASRGYAVFQPNHRGSGGRTVAFRQAGFGEWGRKMLSDMQDGVAALAAKGIMDPKRACIVGASYGGYAALASVTLQKSGYRFAVSVSGPADMASFFDWDVDKHGLYTDTTRYWRAATGMDKGGAGVLKAISPTAHVQDAEAPILLIHGRDDTVVPVEQSREMAAALRHAGKPVDLLEINGGDHWELHEDARLATITSSVNFVLKNDPPD